MSDIVDRGGIEELIERFYSKAMKDETIGHFFTEVVQLDLEEHLPKICDFWEGAIFHRGSYRGNPMRVHIDMHLKSPMKAEHFNKWLALFFETIDENFAGTNADLFKMKAQSIATMMQIKMSTG